MSSAGTTSVCPGCGETAPVGAFCARCGASLEPRAGDGPRWLRLRHFAAASHEAVYRPAITSTLFPGLPRRSHRAFQAGLIAALLSLFLLAALRVAPALISVGVLAIPLLFVLYLRQGDTFRHIPGHLLAISAMVGAVLGAAGMLLTGQLVAQSYAISVTAGMAMNKFVRHGFTIPLAAALLEIVPAVVTRMLSRPPRKALDGFAIGTVGALAFAGAATLTRLAPQFAIGMIASQRTLAGLIVEAGIAGVTVPLTAGAVGGTVGLALWFTPAPDATAADARRTRSILAALAVAVVGIFVGVAITDAAGLGQRNVLLFHVVLMLAAILLLRLALQIALLHEAPYTTTSNTAGCGWCDNAATAMAFCSGCGATAATFPFGTRALTNPVRLLGKWALGNAALAVALIGLSVVVTTKPHRYQCPPDCGRPPIGTPVTALPRYTAPDGAFSVTYPAADTSYDVTTAASTGVTARWTAGDGGVLRLFSEPARGREPRAIAVELLRKKFPDAKIAYEIPNAMVGYQPGYGEAADRWPQSSTGSYLRLRILVLVAVKNDLALVAAAVGPFHEFSPDFGPGPPSGANLQIAQDMSKYVNSFRWKGDPLD